MTKLSEKSLPHSTRNNGQDLLKGAAANLFGFVIRLGARLPFLFVVAILYGKEIFGQYLFAVTIIETMTAVILFGFKRTLFHFLNDDLHQNDKSAISQTILSAMIFCIGFGTILIMPLYFWKDIMFLIFPDKMVEGVYFLLPVAVIYALAEVLLTATRAARKMRYEVTAKSIVEPYVLLAISLVLFFMEYLETGLFIAYWGMNISILVYALYAYKKVFITDDHVWGGVSKTKINAMMRFSAPTAAYDLIGVLILRIDIYFLAAIVSPAMLGVYGIALQIVTIVKKIKQSFDPILEPVISHSVKFTTIKSVCVELSKVSYWIFSIQALIFTLLIFYSGPLLGLFNASGDQAIQTLLVLIGAVIIQSSFGLGELVFLYKKPFVNTCLSFVILFLHAGLCYFLSKEFGILGAAGSLLISYSVTETIRLVLIKYFFDTFPLDTSIIKPIFMSAILYGYLSILGQILELHSAWGITIGTIGGIMVYFLSFFIFAHKEEKYILMQKLKLKKPQQ